MLKPLCAKEVSWKKNNKELKLLELVPFFFLFFFHSVWNKHFSLCCSKFEMRIDCSSASFRNEFLFMDLVCWIYNHMKTAIPRSFFPPHLACLLARSRLQNIFFPDPWIYAYIYRNINSLELAQNASFMVRFSHTIIIFAKHQNRLISK